MRLVELLRSRQRRNLAAEGRAPEEEDRLPEPLCDAGDLPQALVEVLQRGRFERAAANRWLADNEKHAQAARESVVLLAPHGLSSVVSVL